MKLLLKILDKTRNSSYGRVTVKYLINEKGYYLKAQEK